MGYGLGFKALGSEVQIPVSSEHVKKIFVSSLPSRPCRRGHLAVNIFAKDPRP